MDKKRIAIGCDHAGYDLKIAIINHLKAKGFEIIDFGTNSNASIDYPDYGHPVAKSVEDNTDVMGIVICGSGNGINMTVNKHQGIRAALCWTVEIASLARQHNDANVLALPARFIESSLAIQMVDIFLTTDFEGGRHQTRVNKIACS